MLIMQATPSVTENKYITHPCKLLRESIQNYSMWYTCKGWLFSFSEFRPLAPQHFSCNVNSNTSLANFRSD